MPAPLRNRIQLQTLVLERLESGATLEAAAGLPGYPSYHTVLRWRRSDPAFAAQVDRALAWGRGVRREPKIARHVFDELAALDFLARIEAGEAVRDLLVTPGQPNRKVLNSWRRQRPDFARKLLETTARARRRRLSRPRAIPYDEAVADRIILSLHHGKTIPQVLAEPWAPGPIALRRWKRAHPDFAGALQIAGRNGFRLRAPKRCTPELIEAIERRIVDGASLAEVGRTEGFPCAATLTNWMRKRSDVRERIEAACTARDEYLGDMAVDLARTANPVNVKSVARQVGAINLRLAQMTSKRRKGW